MKEESQIGAPKPSDLWRDLLQMQLMMLRDTLPAELQGVVQFEVSDGESQNKFHMNLKGADSDFKTGEASSDLISCKVETTELQVSKVLFVGSANLLDMNISGNKELFVGYVNQAAKVREALR